MRISFLAGEIGAMRRMSGYGPRHAMKLLLDGVLPESVRQLARRMSGASHAKPAWLDLERLGAAPRSPEMAIWGGRAATVREESRRQLTATALPQLLHSEDRNSMAHSVEARVPFLDYRVIEFALGLPDAFKIGAGTTKRVLREAMRQIVPASVLERRDKLGFVTAEAVWMRQRAPQEFRRRLVFAIEASGGVLGRQALSDFDAVLAGGRPFSYLPWRMICFGDWMARSGMVP
jgi:asparagine synthase (glutamine-hydrolysing)